MPDEKKSIIYRPYLTDLEKEEIDKQVQAWRDLGNGAKVRTGDVLAALLLTAVKTDNQKFLQEVREILKGGG